VTRTKELEIAIGGFGINTIHMLTVKHHVFMNKHGMSYIVILMSFTAIFPSVGYVLSDSKACFIRRILVASNAIKTIDSEMIKLIKLHYLLLKLYSTRPKFDV
jgi:hypothetical protein